MTQIRTVALIENPRIPAAVEAREQVAAECRRRGLVVQEAVAEDTDLVIALGGDGTLLRAVAALKTRRTLL